MWGEPAYLAAEVILLKPDGTPSREIGILIFNQAILSEYRRYYARELERLRLLSQILSDSRLPVLVEAVKAVNTRRPVPTISKTCRAFLPMS